MNLDIPYHLTLVQLFMVSLLLKLEIIGTHKKILIPSILKDLQELELEYLCLHLDFLVLTGAMDLINYLVNQRGQVHNFIFQLARNYDNEKTHFNFFVSC